MRYVFLFIFFQILGCANQRDMAKYQSPNPGKALHRDSVMAILQENIGVNDLEIVFPKFPYVFEMGDVNLKSYVFDKDGREINFSFCFADVKNPIIKNIRKLNNPKLVSGQTMTSFAKKLTVDSIYFSDANDYDFFYFFTFTLDYGDYLKARSSEMHIALINDIVKLESQGIRIKLINVYVGNQAAFNIPAEDFVSLKKEHYNKNVIKSKRP